MHAARDAPPPSAVFALAAWARGATRDDVERAFYETDPVGPLHVVIQRILLLQLDPSCPIAGCAALIAALLPGSASVAHSSVLQETIGELLRWGRALVVQVQRQGGSNRNGSAITPTQTAANVANCVVELLRGAAEERRAHEGGAVRAMRAEATTPEPAGRQRADGAGSGARDLLMQRDAARRLADAAGRALETSLGTRSQRNGHGRPEEATMQNGTGQGETAEGLIQDEGAVESIPPETAHWQKFARRIIGAQQLQSLEKKTADSKRSEETKRPGDGARRDRHENVWELRARDRRLAEEEGRVAMATNALEASFGDRLEALGGELNGMEGGVHALDEALYRAVRGTAEKVTELEGAWRRSLSSAPAANPPVPPPPSGAVAAVAPRDAWDRYLRHARSYARAEARLRRFLRRRAAAVASRATELEREVRSFRDLGMARSTKLSEDILQILEQHAAEDGAALAASREDIAAARRDLLRRVGEYRKTGDVELFPADLFNQVLNELRDVEASEGPADGEDSNGGDAAAGAAMDGAATALLPNGPATTDGAAVGSALAPAPAPATPKLRWANGGAPKRQKAVSLRDIQREELRDN